MKPADLTGVRYGMLTAIERNGTSAAGKAQWLCLCDCGESITVLAQNLKQGGTRACGNHGNGSAVALAKQTELYRVRAIDGPNLIPGARYGWCEVVNVDTGDVIFRNHPVSRYDTKGEPSPNAARGMVWLTQQSLIESKRNLSWRQWLTATRCVVELHEIDDVDAVNAAWELLAGRPLHAASGPRPSFAPAAQAIPDITPAQKYALDAMLAETETDDGSDHMERYPMSDEARRNMELSEARRRKPT